MAKTWGMVCRLMVVAGLAAVGSGCQSNEAQPVQPQDFYARHSSAVAPISPLDRPGIISLPDVHAQAPGGPAPGEATPEPTESDLKSLSSTLTPSTLPSAPLTQSATQPGIAENEFMTLGSVVIVVNGTPIFANKVLQQDANVLRGYARQMDLNSFEDTAREQIEKTVANLVSDELEVAAAERTLDPKDIQLAHALTTQWSQIQVAEAGGSEQVARLRALESGEDFEDQERDQYRKYLQELYYFKVINPQIDITAEDERRYYQSHIDQFSTPTQATIILIEASPAKLNGNDKAAKDKLIKIRERALAGEDFADYGRRQNDLPGAGGDEGNGGQMTVQPNTLVLSKVEAQVWKTPVGQISDVIEDHGDYYIFKVLSRDLGGTKPFADRMVQEAITKRLTDLQRTERREAEVQKLESEAIVSSENLEPVMEMARQMYPIWSKR
jgi:parvulin-like peptidyl-prolyl isomerase